MAGGEHLEALVRRFYADVWNRWDDDALREVLAADFAGVDGLSAAVRLRCTGTHRGPVLGIPPTQRRFAYDAAAFFTARDGRLESAWVLGDLDGLGRQLSAGPGAPG